MSVMTTLIDTKKVRKRLLNISGKFLTHC